MTRLRFAPAIAFIALSASVTSVAGAQGQAPSRLNAPLDTRGDTRVNGRVDLFGAAGTRDGDAAQWLRQGSAAAAAAFTRANAYAFGDLRLEGIDGVARDARVSTWSLDAGATSRSPGAWRLGWTASAASPDATGARPVWNARSIAALQFGNSGVWVGVGPGSDGGGGTAGAWTLLGNALFSATIETDRTGAMRRDIRQTTVHGLDSTYTDTAGWHVYPASWTRSDTSFANLLRTTPALTMRADWAAGRWAVSAWAARRAQMDTAATTSAAATITARIANGVGLVAGAGTSSRGPANGLGGPARYVSLGVRFTSPSLTRPAPAAVRPAARAFTVTPAGAGRYRLTLRAPFARTVEVTGDFNGWSSTVLDESSPGIWALTLALSPGVHTINVRINGEAWVVPPGVHTTDDEFNGHVGLIVVP